MRFSFLLTSFLLLVFLPTISAQSIWESAFSKADHDFRDYSIATAADGSGDMVVAGTLHNKLTDERRIHVLKIDGGDASVTFELVYTAAGDSWAKSITAFQNGSSTGYAITGYVDDGGVNRTTVLTLDENGVLLHETMLAQLSATTNGMGLHIAATPDALNDGFVIVGMVHETLNGSDLRTPDKQAFCVKLDQNLGVVWEKYFDSNVGPLYSLDWDVANFVTPTDQGYFITGGKNGLSVIGQQRQGILALMLDGTGTQLWDASYYTGNSIDMGASAWYDQSNQKVYVLANISVSHHLGISVFDAATGALDAVQSFEAFSSNSELDKYGHTLVKLPYADHVTIQGRALDYSWSGGSNQGQIGFLVNYDLSAQSFGVHYLETNNSNALNSIGTYDPLIPAAISAWYYPQALVNLDAQSGGMLSYVGNTGDDVSLVVRKFRHSSPDNYEFCEVGNNLLLDVFNPAGGDPGVGLTETNAPSLPGNPAFVDAPEATFLAINCQDIPEPEPFCTEDNLVQNGSFEQGSPTALDEDIANASFWGGIWQPTTGFSSADFYNTSQALPSSLTSPLPASQGNFGGMWSAYVGNQVFREGMMNELSSTILPNTGQYELSFKVACLGGYFADPELSIWGVNASGLATGTSPVSFSMPTNDGFYGAASSFEFATYPFPSNCDEQFVTLTFVLNSADPGFPASGINHLFFTRKDGVSGGVYIALDDVCLRPLQCCESEMAFNDAVADFTINVNGATTTLSNPSLTDCDELSIDWGDGHVDQVNASVLPISHQYAGSGQYPICIDVMEIAADGSVCFSDRFCEAVTETSLVQLTSDVNVFPNPTGGATAVKWEEAGEFTKVVLLDVNGRILLQQALNASDFTLQIDMSRFSSGIYLLQLTTNTGQLVSKRLVRQ
ncbi:T9SS type A sorting domain-containing protein [Lewinella cohaerens]|uniref:T9SS type A sorting domain-containing protein n=1 Tax=Lewinella cohaerens TaxID=70995 RepID=UPI000364C529|nr:T9SS type A sorting domain-containing protein [Lewinella cohaerens]